MWKALALTASLLGAHAAAARADDVPLDLAPSGATFLEALDVDLATPPSDYDVRFTIDGSEPAATSPAYAGAWHLETSTLLRVRAFRDGAPVGPSVTRQFVRLGSLRTFAGNLPVLVLDNLGKPLADESTSAYVTLHLPQPDGSPTLLSPPVASTRARVHKRGSTSRGFPKPSLRLETWGETDDEGDVDWLGLPRDSDWVLYAPYTDKTLLRDVLAYELWRDLGRYAPRTRLVELFGDQDGHHLSANDYLGVYVLMEPIKRGPHRVPIARLKPTDAEEPAVTGGYILKIDRLGPGEHGFRTQGGLTLVYVEPSETKITPPQAAWIKGYVDEFERVLAGPDFADPKIGYARYIDVDSFIDYHLHVELTRNIDGRRLSTYLFKDRNGKLTMGPPWDYNLSLGNANYLDGWKPDGWQYETTDMRALWWPRLFEDPAFIERVKARWRALRGGPWAVDAILAKIERDAAALGPAEARDHRRWGTLGVYVWPNPWFGIPTYAPPLTYDDELRLLRGFVADRLAWLDAQLL